MKFIKRAFGEFHKLHSPPMLVDKTNFGLVIYNLLSV